VKLALLQFTFSGVTSDPVHATIITSTIIVVFFTTLVGIPLNPTLREFIQVHSQDFRKHQHVPLISGIWLPD